MEKLKRALGAVCTDIAVACLLIFMIVVFVLLLLAACSAVKFLLFYLMGW